MAQVLFVGEYMLTMDEKGRLLIPSAIRRRLDPAQFDGSLFIVTGQNRRPWIYTDRRFEQIAAETKPPQNDDDAEFNQLIFALATYVELDRKGRMLVPERLVRECSLRQRLALLGLGDHLEIWNLEEWEKHRQSVVGAR